MRLTLNDGMIEQELSRVASQVKSLKAVGLNELADKIVDDIVRQLFDCQICQGPLIRSELDYGTCGHCGKRSL